MPNTIFLQYLGDLGEVQSYRANDIIHLDGIPPDRIYLLLEGKVKHIIYDEEGEEKTFLILQKGDIFGEVSYFKQDINRVISQAMSPCVVARIPDTEFKRVLEEHPELYVHIVRLLSTKLQIILSQIKDMAFKSAQGRLANLLLRLAEQHGIENGPQRILIDMIITHQDLANMISAYRSTVTKLVVKMKDQGLIDIKNKKITVLDEAGLRDLGRITKRVEKPTI